MTLSAAPSSGRTMSCLLGVQEKWAYRALDTVLN
jgi:hypothetical protein